MFSIRRILGPWESVRLDAGGREIFDLKKKKIGSCSGVGVGH